MIPYLEKLVTKIGLVEWLKVKALSSNPSTTQSKKKKNSKMETMIFTLGIFFLLLWAFQNQKI
jgi:hypothetical protein